MISGAKQAPAAQRNREPIANVLAGILPSDGNVLEIASGTGEHAVWFAARFPGITWWPSDPDWGMRESIAAWAADLGIQNFRQPTSIDVTDSRWIQEIACENLVAIVNINMIHVAPWAACEGLLAGAARLLNSGGVLYLYGPFRRGGEHTSSSNAEFDASLRARNPIWGVRDLDDVALCAETNGFTLEEMVSMPANNFSIVFRRVPTSRHA